MQMATQFMKLRKHSATILESLKLVSQKLDGSKCNK